jgi:hypothetical protein
MGLGRAALACLGATLACSIPTDVCGCTPARSIVFVRGTLTDAGGTPVAGARLYFDGVPAGQSTSYRVDVRGPGDAQTDATGAFHGLVYSSYSPGPRRLRAAVVRPALSDTVSLSAGTAGFRNERERPDTVLVILRLP